MVKLDPIIESREDHRKIRDELFNLIDALQSKDIVTARKILDRINALVGPHFRYEEDALYPALRLFLGGYVDQLLKENEGVITTARSCSGLLNKKDILTSEEANQALKLARTLLIHVSNCDGLSIFSERLDKKIIDNLSKNLSVARMFDVPLLDWAEIIKKK
ncbi:MAG: hemerythrin domain-containing protein [Candidatus Brocadiaceae bacterium]|nr:hemerythrin domain-containing protein [Candidatus Brocadiaceae bacterium]